MSTLMSGIHRRSMGCSGGDRLVNNGYYGYDQKSRASR